MKTWMTILIALMAVSFPARWAWAQTDAPESEGKFTLRGTLTRRDLPAKTLLVKNEGGLELTFHLKEAGRVSVGEETGSGADPAAGDEVEIEYEYNADYEKIIRSLKKRSSPASSQKTQALST